MMCLDTHHTYMDTCTYLQQAIRVDHIYIILTMMLEKNQIATLTINKSEIVEGVCDTERRDKPPHDDIPLSPASPGMSR